MASIATAASTPYNTIAASKGGQPAAVAQVTGGSVATGADLSLKDDDALVALVAAGQERALAEIVRRHSGRLRGLAFGFAGVASEADDIVQETFVSLWKNAARWKPDGAPLGAWLTRTAMNRAIDRERRRKTRAFFGLDEMPDPADPQTDQHERLEKAGELAAVMDDIRALPARQRAAIVLAAEGERSNAEIAKTLGQSVGAVEQLLVRARRTLRARLAERQ